MTSNTFDGIVGLICVGLMIFAEGMIVLFFFLAAVFLLTAWSETDGEEK